MPVYPCKHPTCIQRVPRRGQYCDGHSDRGRDARADRDRRYDRYSRDPEAKAFYNSAAWLRARAKKLADCPWCERCRREWARHVHHIKPLKHCTPTERVDQRFLKSVCPPCHNIEEAETAKCS